MEAKPDVRQRGRQRRSGMLHKERTALSRAVIARLKKEIEWKVYRRVLVFLPIERLNEIDTWPLVLWLWKNRREVSVYTPLVVGNQFQAVQIRPESTFSNSQWGIPEPADGPRLLPKESLDLVLVPLLGFDAQGHRVGYGRGFFDKFLKGHPGARRVGVGHEFMFSPTGISHEPHDQPMHAVVTEAKMHLFK